MSDHVATAKKSYTLPPAAKGESLTLFLLDENGDILSDEGSAGLVDTFFSTGGDIPKAKAKP